MPTRYDSNRLYPDAITTEQWTAWQEIHHHGRLEDADYVLARPVFGDPMALMAARWTFYHAGLRHLIKALAVATLLFSPALPSFAAGPCKVNVNTSSPLQLQLFARTGPVLAARLASGRPYKALEAVDAVKGVGPSWMAVNGPHVALSGPTTCGEKIKAAPKVAAQSPKL